MYKFIVVKNKLSYTNVSYEKATGEEGGREGGWEGGRVHYHYKVEETFLIHSESQVKQIFSGFRESHHRIDSDLKRFIGLIVCSIKLNRKSDMKILWICAKVLAKEG